MSRQHRPRRKPADESGDKVRIPTSNVSVSAAAASALGNAASKARTRAVNQLTQTIDIREVRAELGNEGLRQAAIDAGRRPPSDRTLRRWGQQGRIPHADVAELAQRRAAVERMGGVKAVAEATGRTVSSIYKWQRGETQNLTGSAKWKLLDARTQDALKRAGALDSKGQLKTAVVTLTASVEIRYDSERGYDYRDKKVFRFDESTAPLSHEDTYTLARAIAIGDNATAVALIEEHASLNYAAFDVFSDAHGFHIDQVHDLHIRWV
ncbi:MAG: hypothetical protein WAW17_07870 [Rhodococcus sp. (in: high G+C Gram-positive bacteria)]|uniref:hypothetical protein n=1 Tax=Rhodococcus sp. TaxID=1831 RepID=UPI003BB0956B